MAAGASMSRTAEYRRFQQELADEISPDEASMAEDAFRRGRVALWTVAGGWAALVLLAALLQGGWAEGVLSDVAAGALVLASLVLGARYRMPFAGRLLLSLSTLEMFVGDVSLSLYSREVVDTVLVLLIMALFWWLGGLLDRGASVEERLRRPRWAVGGLWVFALIYGTLAVASWVDEGRLEGAPFPVASLLAAGLCAVWPWWPGPWVERGRPALVPDADLLLRAAMKRWLAQLAGRILAILFAVFPLFLFLCHLGLQEKGLQPPQDAVTSRSPGPRRTTVYWYWPRALPGLEGRAEGRYLVSADLGSSELYVVPGENNAVAAAREKVEQDDKDVAAFAGLRRHLGPFRLDAAGDLAAAMPADGSGAALLQPVQGRSRPRRGHPEGEAIHFSLGGALIALTPARIDLLEQQLPFTQTLLAVCGLLSFILLWRRGGDSPAARWLAVCLAGTALLAAEPYIDLYLPAMTQCLWVETLQSPLRGVLLGALSLLQGLAHPIAYSCGVVFAVALVHLCWPPPLGSHRRWLSVSGRTAVILLALLVPAFVGLVLGRMLTSFGVLPDRLAAMGTPAFVLCALTTVGGGALLRRRTTGRSEIPELGIRAGLAFLCFQAAFWMALLAWLDEPLPPWSPWVGIACVLSFALLSAWLIFRRDFLHLAAGRDLGQILFFAGLPVLFETSENLSGYLMADTLFASDAGKWVLGVLIVLALFAPLQQLLERHAAYLAVADLRRVEKAVESSLEWLVHLGDANAVRQAAAGFFAELEVAEALLYRRAADGRLERLVGPSEAPETLMPSERLRIHLAGAGGTAIDLTRVHLELRHFFLQHELARLEKATGGRYLLPVCLGRSLRGLLVLPNGPASRRVCRDVTGAEVGKLGLVVAEAGRTTYS